MNFVRKAHLQPFMIGYIDEPHDNQRFRHLHSLIHVKKEVVPGFEKFIRKPEGSTKPSRAEKAWHHIHPRGTVHIVEISAQDLPRVVGYSAKAWALSDRFWGGNAFDLKRRVWSNGYQPSREPLGPEPVECIAA